MMVIQTTAALTAAGPPVPMEPTTSEVFRQPSVPRQGFLLWLLRLVSAKGFIMMKGPPCAGKSWIIDAITQAIHLGLYKKWFACVVPIIGTEVAQLQKSFPDYFDDRIKALYGDDAKPWTYWSSSSSGGEELPVLILIDELHAMYNMGDKTKPLADAVKRSMDGRTMRRVRILGAAVCDQSVDKTGARTDTFFETTPEVLVGLRPALGIPERVDAQPEMGLGLTKDEFTELLALQFEDWSEKYHLNPAVTPTFLKYQDTKDHIWHITAGQVGVITLILDDLEQHLKSLREPSSFSEASLDAAGDSFYWEGVRSNEQLRSLQGSRAFAALSLRPEDQLRISILRKLVGAADEPFKETNFEPAELEEAKKLQYDGFLFHDRSAYRFWTPLHLAYAERCLYHNTIKRDAVDAPTSFKLFIESVIEHMIRQGDLKQTLSVLANNKILESRWRASFCQAALSLLPRGYEVAPDVGPGYVDYWMSPANWAVELPRSCIKLDEREQRFATGSRYSIMPFEEYIVLDFRSSSTSRQIKNAEKRMNKSTWHLFMSEDRNSATLVNSDGKRKQIGPF